MGNAQQIEGVRREIEERIPVVGTAGRGALGGAVKGESGAAGTWER